MSHTEKALREIFEEDADTCDTTLESSLSDEEEQEEEKSVVMSSDLTDTLKELHCLKEKYIIVQAHMAGWNQATVDLCDVVNARTRMVDFNTKHEELFDKIFSLCNDAAEFKKNRVDLDAIGAALTKSLNSIDKLVSQRSGGSGSGTSSGSTVDLPRLGIPIFDGKRESWMSFKGLFTSGVVNHRGLSNVQKLQYLMANIKGEAERIVKGFSITDDNFDKAWSLLEKRFDNTREIIFALLRKFVHQPSCTKECPDALKELMDTSLEAIRSLDNLTNPTDWDPILVFMIMEKMDPATRKEWYMSLSGSLIPTFEDVMDWLGDHVNGLQAAGTAVKQNNSRSVVKSNFSSNSKPKSKSKSYKCYMCNESHSIYQCDKFAALTVDDREAFVKSKNLCFNCLSSKHSVKECESKKKCSVCQRKHNALLHRATQPEVVNAHVASKSGVASVLLSTAMVKFKDSFGSFRVCRVLLDPGSEASFVTQKCTTLLGLQPSKCDVQVTGISSVKVGKAKGIVGLEISSLIKDFNFEVRCLVYNQVTGRLPSFTCTGEAWEFLRGLPLADPKFLEPREVDILLGADVTGFLSLAGCVKRDQHSPVAMATELGWVISGPVNRSGLVGDANSSNYSVRVHHSKIETDDVIQKFWELEQVPEHPQWTDEERECEKHFEVAHFREQGGRYGNPIPFNGKLPKLGLSRFTAMRRLLQLERRLQNSEHKETYYAFMSEYRALGHMEKIPPAECEEKLGLTNYLPHHFVLREESTTTKLRVVFDGSAKTSTGTSINSCILVGPKVQDDLFHHLLRFRFNPVALKADIVKMFRQFLVSRADTDLQRILWRDSPDAKVEDYRLKTVTYGTASGPHSAARCLKQLSLDYAEEYPEASEVLARNFYVDDLMVSTPTAESAIRLQKGLDALVEKAELKLGKWDSNDPEVLEHVPVESRAKNSKFNLDDGKFVTKALGVRWDSLNDFLLFEGFVFRDTPRVTKCVVLSEMSRIFDPLGLLAPLSVKIKIFFQKLWMPIESEDEKHRVLDWNDEIPEHLRQEWDSYQQGMGRINEVKLPRVLCVAGTLRYELHGFSDASEKAYSAVIYFRCFGEDDNITVRLMCAKTKVAPLKSQSIPRLELCGALLLSRLVISVTTGMSLVCPMYLWTDSELVLKWISGPSRRRNTFVANRVAEIQELVPVESWKFIPGEINPADCASRGMSADELVDFDLWWHGPEFLSQPGVPTFVGKGIPPFANLEEKREPRLPVSHSEIGIVQEEVLSHNSQVQSSKVTNEWYSKFSDLIKLKRAVAYVLRFRFNCSVKLQDRKFGELTVSELGEAFTVLVKLAQREDYEQELSRLESGKSVLSSSRILSLNPFVDQSGVLRVGGRLQRSILPSTTKHQVILSGSHQLTKLLIRHRHIELLHGGFQLLWTSLQREYWIVNARSNIRNLVRKCLKCKRLKAKLAQQLMGSLPPARVIPSRPFTHVGVDYAGPYSLSIAKGRGKKHCTGYFCVFMCFATRAVHIEYALELTSESFIGALKRFVARRGMSSDIYSDCGTNFVGAERELRELLSSFNFNNCVSRFLNEKGIQWHFNAPAGPHHGGFWEAGVKSVKHHLKRHVGLGAISLEEFSTVLCMVEAALNSRPLCALSPDPTDLEVLTPGHFLVGEPLTAIPEPDLQHIQVNRLSRWQRSQQIFQHFWSRWSKEYVHTLQQRNQWKKPADNVKVGDLVLLKEDNAPPLKWRMGRVTDVYPGEDGLVRVVKVKTQTGDLKRPIVKICPLLSKEDL